jgi:hypothetical protein
MRDLDSWASALLAAAVSRRELGLGTFVHRPGEACRRVNVFLLAIVWISGLWGINALLSPSAFRDLHAFVCGRLARFWPGECAYRLYVDR